MIKTMNTAEIIRRGWTDKNIEVFLGEPHAFNEASGANVYCQNCVETAERTEAFRSAQRVRVDNAVRQYNRAVQALRLAK